MRCGDSTQNENVYALTTQSFTLSNIVSFIHGTQSCGAGSFLKCTYILGSWWRPIKVSINTRSGSMTLILMRDCRWPRFGNTPIDTLS